MDLSLGYSLYLKRFNVLFYYMIFFHKHTQALKVLLYSGSGNDHTKTWYPCTLEMTFVFIKS